MRRRRSAGRAYDNLSEFLHRACKDASNLSPSHRVVVAVPLVRAPVTSWAGAGGEGLARPVGEVAEHLAVVGGDDDGGSGGAQGLGDLVDEGGREVVGRFVEQDDVGAGGQPQSQVQAAALTLGQPGAVAASSGTTWTTWTTWTTVPVASRTTSDSTVAHSQAGCPRRRLISRSASQPGIGGRASSAAVQTDVAEPIAAG